MLAMSETQEMLMEMLKWHAKGILVNKATLRLGETSLELTLEGTSINTRLDWKQFMPQGVGLPAEQGGVFRGEKLFHFLLVPLCKVSLPPAAGS